MEEPASQGAGSLFWTGVVKPDSMVSLSSHCLSASSSSFLSLLSVLMLKSGCLTALELQCVLVHTPAGGYLPWWWWWCRPNFVPEPKASLCPTITCWTVGKPSDDLDNTLYAEKLEWTYRGDFISILRCIDQNQRQEASVAVWMKTAPRDS